MAVGQPFVGLQCKRVLVYTGSASGHIYFSPFPPLHALPLRVMETVWRPTLRSHAKITPALLTSMEAKGALICPPSVSTLLLTVLTLWVAPPEMFCNWYRI